MGGQEIFLLVFLKEGHHPYRFVKELHQIPKGIPEKAAGPEGNINPGPLKSGEGNGFHPQNSLIFFVPHGPDPQKVKGAGQVLTPGTHGRRAPDNHGQRARVTTVVLQMAA